MLVFFPPTVWVMYCVGWAAGLVERVDASHLIPDIPDTGLALPGLRHKQE